MTGIPEWAMEKAAYLITDEIYGFPQIRIDVARALAAERERCEKIAEDEPEITEADNDRSLVEQLTGALRFIIAFYEPGQTYLDTNAWKHAEAGGRAALKRGEAALDKAS